VQMRPNSGLVKRAINDLSLGLFPVGVSQAAVLPYRLREFFDFLPAHAADALDDHLRDALTAANDHRFTAQIDGDQLDLAAIVRVDRSRAIDQRYPFPERKAAARPDLRLEPRRQSNRDARRNQRPLERLETQVLLQIRRQIHTG